MGIFLRGVSAGRDCALSRVSLTSREDTIESRLPDVRCLSKDLWIGGLAGVLMRRPLRPNEFSDMSEVARLHAIDFFFILRRLFWNHIVTAFMSLSAKEIRSQRQAS